VFAVTVFLSTSEGVLNAHLALSSGQPKAVLQIKAWIYINAAAKLKHNI
jgi:hypothetical protein